VIGDEFPPSIAEFVQSIAAIMLTPGVTLHPVDGQGR
jgi:hypothetical protein